MKESEKPKFWFEGSSEEDNESDSLLMLPAKLSGIMKVKIIDEEDRLVLLAELPDFSKDEIHLKVTPTTINISAEKRKVSVEKKKGFFKAEKGYNAIQRSFTLSEEIDPESVKAKYENGLLKIIMPKKEAMKRNNEIEVE